MSAAADYLREQARQLRELARGHADDTIREELEKLADHCERLAREMSHNGHAAEPAG